MSRLFIKNIPKNLTEVELKKTFEKMGFKYFEIERNGQNRRFAYIGYKQDEDAQKAIKYFNNTYIYSSKIQVSAAESVDQLKNSQQQQNFSQQKNVVNEEKPKLNNFDSEAKRAQFQEFIEMMKGGKRKIDDNIVVHKEQKLKKVKKEEIIQEKQEKKQEKKQEIKIEKIQEQKKIDESGKKIDDKRLYVLNIPFNTTEEEVRKIFQQYGQVQSIKMPKGPGGKFKGFAYICYQNSEEAIRAFAELDNKIVLGRYLHIRPAFEDNNPIDQQQNQQTFEKSSFKKQQKIDLKKQLSDESNWNSLFLNQNSVLQYVSNKFGITKADLFDQNQDNQAVKVALAETEVINETIEWLKNQGINLDFMNSDRQNCLRSTTMMLIKNLPQSTSSKGIQELFSYYGAITKFSMCPNKSLALVMFQNEGFADNAFKNLSYYVYKNEPLYLEWAPIQFQNDGQIIQQEQKKDVEVEGNERILFVKNLNFKTTENDLKQHFTNDNVNIKSVKIAKNNDLSKGFGFIEFSSNNEVQWCLKNLQNSICESHSLQLSISKKMEQNAKTAKTNKKTLQIQEGRTKIVVRNLAFEATKVDIKSLFKNFVDVKNVRIPKKMDGTHRGFAFVEFMTIDDANKVYNSLQNTHLYGRKLNFEWANNNNADEMVQLN